jgi:hypothetical protein
MYDLTLIASPSTPCFGATTSEQFQIELLNLCETTSFYSQVIPDINLFKQDPDFNQNSQKIVKFDEF